MEIHTTTTKMTLGDELQTAIRIHLSKHPHQSATGLANEKAGSTTCFNVFKGKASNPTPRTAVGIIQAMNKGKGWDQIFKKYEDLPILAKTLRDYVAKHYPVFEKNIIAKSELQNALEDENIFRAIILTQDDYGISKLKIKELFGIEVLERIENLIDKKVLIEKDGRIFSTVEFIRLTPKGDYKLTKNFLKKFNIEDFGKGIGNAFFYHYRTNINKEYVMPILSKKMAKFTKEVEELLGKPEAKGNDTVWFISAMDSLLRSINIKMDSKGLLQ